MGTTGARAFFRLLRVHAAPPAAQTASLTLGGTPELLTSDEGKAPFSSVTLLVSGSGGGLLGRRGGQRLACEQGARCLLPLLPGGDVGPLQSRLWAGPGGLQDTPAGAAAQGQRAGRRRFHLAVTPPLSGPSVSRVVGQTRCPSQTRSLSLHATSVSCSVLPLKVFPAHWCHRH